MDFNLEKGFAVFFLSLAVLILSSGFFTGFLSQDVVVADSDVFQNFSLEELTASDPGVEESSVSETVDLQSGLQGYYRMDNVSESGNYGLHFDGVDDYVEISHRDELKDIFGGSLNFTLSAWIKVEEWENHATVVHKARNGWWSSSTASLWVQNDGITAVIGSNEEGNTDGSYIRVPDKPALNKWHHVASVANSTHLSLFVDGERKGTKKITDYIKANLTANSEPVTIGRRTPNDVESINGSVTDIRVFESNLSDKDIQKLFKKKPVSSENLVIHQKFDEGISCDLDSGKRCLRGDSVNNYDGLPQSFAGGLNTGSGWTDRTPFDFGFVEDSSGNQLEARVQGSSLKFDGDDESVKVPDTQNVTFKEVAATAWVYLQDRNDYRQVVSKSPSGALGSNDFTFSMRNSRDSNFLYSVNVDGSWIGISDSPPLNEWHHVAMSYDGNQLRVYRDGKLVGATDAVGSLYQNNESIRIGAIDNPSRDNWKGMLEDVRVYNTSLTHDQINQTLRGDQITERPVIRYMFNGGPVSCDLTSSERCIIDSSGRNNRGLPQGFQNNVLNNKSGWTTQVPSLSASEGILGTNAVDISRSQFMQSSLPGFGEDVSISTWVKTESDLVLNGGFEEDKNCVTSPTHWNYPEQDGWVVNSNTRSGESGKSFGNNWNGEAVCGSNPSPGVWPSAYFYQDINLNGRKEVNFTAWIDIGGNPDECTNPSEGLQCVLEDDARLHMYAFDEKGSKVGEKKGLWGGEQGKSSGWNFYSLTWKTPENTSRLRIQIDGGDGNDNYIDPETGHGGNAGLFIDDVKLYADSSIVSNGVEIGSNSLRSGCKLETRKRKTWTFLAATWDGEYVREYVDGELCNRQASIERSTDGLLTAGKTFEGKIDELKVYNRSLSQKEISGLSFR